VEMDVVVRVSLSGTDPEAALDLRACLNLRVLGNGFRLRALVVGFRGALWRHNTVLNHSQLGT